jgi:hypothetical protein
MPRCLSVHDQLQDLKNSVAFIPQVNYTDWPTAAVRRILVPTSADEGVSRGQRGGSPQPLISVL